MVGRLTPTPHLDPFQVARGCTALPRWRRRTAEPNGLGTRCQSHESILPTCALNRKIKKIEEEREREREKERERERPPTSPRFAPPYGTNQSCPPVMRYCLSLLHVCEGRLSQSWAFAISSLTQSPSLQKYPGIDILLPHLSNTMFSPSVNDCPS